MTEEVKNRILVNQHVVNEYRLRLTRPITEIDDFEDEFQLFASAGDRDIIYMDVVTPGGQLDTAHMLCRAIAETPATTIAYIGPTCASAGTAIALACDEWEIDDMSSFMIHTGSYGYVGMAPHIEANVRHNTKMMERFVRNSYTGFLTEEEILSVLKGVELYFEGEELANRLESYAEYRDSIREAYLQESEESVDTETVDG